MQHLIKHESQIAEGADDDVESIEKKRGKRVKGSVRDPVRIESMENFMSET
jgi:hypothetical protein